MYSFLIENMPIATASHLTLELAAARVFEMHQHNKKSRQQLSKVRREAVFKKDDVF